MECAVAEGRLFIWKKGREVRAVKVTCSLK